MSWTKLELRARLAPFKPSSKISLLTVPRQHFFCGSWMLYLSLFVMLSCLVIAALWSPAENGLTSWLLFVILNSVFVTFPCGILGQVRYLIVSIPDLCSLSYFRLMSFLVLKGRGRESWLLYSVFLTSLFCGSSSRCRLLVCSV